MTLLEIQKMFFKDNIFRREKNMVFEYYENLVKLVDDNKNLEEILKAIKSLYSYVKKLSLDYFKGFEFSEILNIVLDSERVIPKYYIMNTKFNGSIFKNFSSQDDSAVLNYIVLKVRQHLWKKISFNNLNFGSLEYFDLTNYCKEASKTVQSVCDDLKIKSKRILLEPGFTEGSSLYLKTGIHYFSIIEFNGQKYLIDCTYSQFFLLRKSILERIGIPNLSGCSCGIFMTMTESRRKVAEKILKDGWILLTDDVLKDYLDGFAISYRNGLYYEETNDFSYTTKYTAEDYYNFLNHDDSQLNYEERDFLGFQKRALKDPYLSFNKR